MALSVATASSSAQRPAAPTGGNWSHVKIAKWTLLAVAAGFGVYALDQTHRADRAYRALDDLCHRSGPSCALTNGRYADGEAERLYAESRTGDRQAQLGIIGGQVTLLGSASLFLFDLRNGRGPGDIPYPSSRFPSGVIVGLRVGF
ncbi:MAG: hypothetical protein M3068_07500 [Gemmatimonadota bacterium]|nr:hypothetical protein [Gemmatimonadota bacterium]